MWQGDYAFLLNNLIQKDFKVRYRNMSLGVLWSLLNPLVMMGALTFVFTIILPSSQSHYPVFVLCGLVPYNFFSLAWSTGTSSLLENANIIKRVSIPREVVPIASVLGNCVHLVIQIGLLLTFVLVSGFGMNWNWLWLPLVWGLEIVFVSGLALFSSGVNVYVRDTRYIVDSINMLLFWVVPIFYSFNVVPSEFREIYQFNPVAALVLALRNILMDSIPPPASLLLKLTASSVSVFLIGLWFFRQAKRRFYDYI